MRPRRLVPIVFLAIVALAACNSTTRSGKGLDVGHLTASPTGTAGGVGPDQSSSPVPGASGAAPGSGQPGGFGAAGPGGGSPGSTGSGGVAGGPGGGGLSASAPARYVAGVRGITPTAIRIGVRFVSQQGAAAFTAATGTVGVNPGDTKAMAQAMVDDINSRGGLGGLKVQPYYLEYDVTKILTQQTAAENQRHCEYFAHDAKVFAVVSGVPGDAVLAGCMAAFRLPYVQDAVSPYMDNTVMKQTYGYFYTPAEPNASRMARFWIDGLNGEGFFGGGSKVGLVRLSGTTQDRVSKFDIKPELARIGHPLTSEVQLSDAQQASEGVLQFRAAGIDRVLILDDSSLVAQVWMNDAESQAYRPRYGLNSINAPEVLVHNAPANQLNNALGVGWYHPYDVPSVPAAEISPAEHHCVDLMKAHGIVSADTVSYGLMIYTCDVFSFLEAAWARVPRFDEAGLLAGAEGLGNSWATSATFAAQFGSGRLDGTAAVRNFAYDGGCKCFVYRGQPYAVG